MAGDGAMAVVTAHDLATPLVIAAELPPLLQEVAELTSVSAALTLALHFGAERMYIRQVMAADHPLAQAVGLDHARAIAAQYGGDYVTWPAATAALRRHEARRLRRAAATAALRRHEARRLRRAGCSLAQIGRALGIQQRAVLKIVRGIPKGPAGPAGPGRRHGHPPGLDICPICGHRPRPRPRPSPATGDARQLTLL